MHDDTAPALNISQSILGQPWRWREVPTRTAEAIAQTHGIAEPVARILAIRGITQDTAQDILTPTLRHWLPDPSIFKDMDKAVARIMHALTTDEPIVIFGDYDVDGATSAAILVRFFRAFGTNVGTYIPDRIREGYGPNVDAMRTLAAKGTKLIITVDCGTQSFAALAEARALGMDVIVVDHHKAPLALPCACAIINPNRYDETPDGAHYGMLAAVGVSFLLCVALNRALRETSQHSFDLMSLLDAVALGTVCDVVPLTGLNRAFVAQGLKILSRREHLGLRVLMDKAGLSAAPDAGSLGFYLGPRINAGGRIGEADLGLRLLTTENPQEADTLATQLNALNTDRKAIEAAVFEEACAQAERQTGSLILVHQNHWHPGVIGVVAGRLKERFGKPAVVIALHAGVGKGSGRSITGVDLGAAILAAKEEGLIQEGGGHAMAAGLTVAEAHIPALSAFLSAHLDPAVQHSGSQHALWLDALIAPGGVTGALAQSLTTVGPFGAGWPAPRFAIGPVQVMRCDVVGQDHVRLFVKGQDGHSFKAMAFRHADTVLGETLRHNRGAQFWLAGRIQRDDWSHTNAAELHIDDAALLSS